jgi:ribosomal protein S18 acetylase RimI-like enzyme
MIVRDWRGASPELLAPIYEDERQRWLRLLQWDPARAWREVETARTTWGLPGFLVLDTAGKARGMLFYLAEEDRIDIGGLTSDAPAVTDRLIASVLDAAAASGVRQVRGSLLDGVAGLRSSLTRNGFDVETQLYLSRLLAGGAAESTGIASAWSSSDVCETAGLLRRAYAGGGWSFLAPNDEPAEWERYVRNLVDYAGCGTFNAEMTAVVREGQALCAAILITEIAPNVAHIVQLAVDPLRRGQGLASSLLAETSERLASHGYRALTLQVAESNHAARALYDRAGFTHVADFLAATTLLR